MKITPETFHPIDDQVVIRRDPDITHDGKFELPQPKIQVTGEVLACGPGRIHPALPERIPMQVKAGDRVMWKQYAGDTTIDHNANRDDDEDIAEIFHMGEGSIIAILTPDE